MITVSRLRGMSSTWVKVLERAMPVTMPGRAIGRIDEEGDRVAAEEALAADGERASVPRTSAIAVAITPAFERGEEALRARTSLLKAWVNQWVSSRAAAS